MAGVALVSGGASGIGAATVRRLADAGHSIGVVDRDVEATHQLTEEVTRASGVRAIPIVCDVTVPEQVAAAVEEATSLGPLRIIVNCAGLAGRSGRVQDLPLDVVTQVMDVNLWGTLNMLRSAAPALMRAGGGAIVNVASIAGLQGSRGQVPYSAAKAGVIGLTYAAAKELMADRIRVNAVAPGFIATPMTDEMPATLKERWGLERMVLGGGLAQPEQVASCITFLASADASFVTGVVLPVDGGFRLGYP
jgi:NAD(P)-dependent dehydrogenase (short-subunit alcohol dehydrogenase family)